MKLRGFEKISKYADVEFQMPERKTQKSAGYDFCLPEDAPSDERQYFRSTVHTGC
mgnify:CR=1 FL=1